MDIGWDAAAIVAHRAGAVRIERHGYFGRKSSKGFVDGVVHRLIDHMVEARTVIGIADIHARPLAYGVEALEDLDRLGAILGRVFAGRFSHWRHLRDEQKIESE